MPRHPVAPTPIETGRMMGQIMALAQMQQSIEQFRYAKQQAAGQAASQMMQFQQEQERLQLAQNADTRAQEMAPIQEDNMRLQSEVMRLKMSRDMAGKEIPAWLLPYMSSGQITENAAGKPTASSVDIDNALAQMEAAQKAQISTEDLKQERLATSKQTYEQREVPVPKNIQGRMGEYPERTAPGMMEPTAPAFAVEETRKAQSAEEASKATREPSNMDLLRQAQQRVNDEVAVGLKGLLSEATISVFGSAQVKWESLTPTQYTALQREMIDRIPGWAEERGLPPGLVRDFYDKQIGAYLGDPSDKVNVQDLLLGLANRTEQ